MSTKPPPSTSDLVAAARAASLAKAASASTLSLEQRLANLEKAIKVTDDGVFIESAKKLTVKAMTIEIEGTALVIMKGGASVEVKGGATLVLQGGTVASLKAAVVKLNNGSSPVAAVGSRVVPSAPPFFMVDSGNATVLV